MNAKQKFDLDTKQSLDYAEHIVRRYKHVPAAQRLPEVVLKLRTCIKDKTRRNQIIPDSDMKTIMKNWSQGFCYGCTYIIYHAAGKDKVWIPMEIFSFSFDGLNHGFISDIVSGRPFDITACQFLERRIPYEEAEPNQGLITEYSLIAHYLARYANIDLMR
ncbi:MAG: hypothetical protein LBF37_00655 [Rickettsiales bacterium]|jgi:hypothetical protein|nr:hypothetical protein [Rickettsiales bacterium]